MINFLRNNYYRVKSRKYYIVIAIIMTMVSIFFAVYINSKAEIKGNVALITRNKGTTFQSKYIKFTTLTNMPEKSELVLGKYDGLIIDKGNGKYEALTIKGDDFKKMLLEITTNPRTYVPAVKNARGIGTNIIGYLLMFILIQCILFMFLLAEDIEQKQIERIAAAPISFLQYLFSNFLFVFALIFVPVMLILTAMKVTMGFHLGFSLMQYAGLIGLICSLGIALAMFINSIVKTADTANMMGSALVLLTTILSGSFYSFEKGNTILQKVIWIIPQKDYLSFVQAIENRKAISEVLPQILYVIMITIILFVCSIIKIKKDYVLRVD